MAAAITSLLQGGVKEIVIMSAAFPPLTLQVSDLLADREGPPHPLVSFLKPTIILRGGALGTNVIAPGGQVDPNAWKTTITVTGILALIGAITVAGALYRWGARRG